jgi:hypothetical protein
MEILNYHHFADPKERTEFTADNEIHKALEVFSLIRSLAHHPDLWRTEVGEMLMGVIDGFYYHNMLEKSRRMFDDVKIGPVEFNAIRLVDSLIKDAFKK